MTEVSLICTVYNEGEDIRELMDSLVEQTEYPDEAIFVDAGSTDNTVEVIEEYQEDHDWIRIVVEEGCNIAEGRNIAVEHAENDYIIGTDAGCILDSEWVEAMTNGFEEDYTALSGLWQPQSENLFEFVQGEIRGHHYKPENVPDNWAPSSRSVGFTREAWEDAGKYPEHLYTGEDAKFNSNMRRGGHEWHVVRDAMVYWKMRPTWRAYYKQFHQYGEGDARAGNLFDYPGKILGISKVFWRLSFTWIGLIGLVLTPIFPPAILLAFAGFTPQYLLKIPSLRSAVKQKGLKAIFYWDAMIFVESFAFWVGFHRELLRKVFK